MKNSKLGTYTHNDETYNFNFTTSLSASEKITFVNSVVDTIVSDNYNSMIKDIVFDHMIIQLFTNVGGSYFENSENKIDAIEQFLEETNIVDIVKANMEFGLLEELSHSVDLAIEYRTGIHPSPIADSLASLINTLEKKINEIDLSETMEMAQKFSSIAGDFTPESLVNAYMNGDIHKNNLEEVAESKKNKKNKKNEIKIDEDLGEAIRAVVKEDKEKKNAKSKK